MTDDDDDTEVLAVIRTSVDSAVRKLVASEVPEETLAEFLPSSRKLLIFPTKATFRPIGKVWRLGVFLLDRAGTLYAAGSTTRAVEPGYPGHQSISQELRREYRAAAHRGPFAAGETINFDAVGIAVDAEALRSSTGQLFIDSGVALVRWNASATANTAADFTGYLAERVGLLVDPPDGA